MSEDLASDHIRCAGKCTTYRPRSSQNKEIHLLRVRRLLGDRQIDQEVPQVQRLRARPSLDRIVAVEEA